MDSRSQLIAQINALHEEQEHQKIIALIERDAPTSLDYELTGLLARAYINYAQPYMDSFKELIGHAVELLRGVEAEGMADPVWYYRGERADLPRAVSRHGSDQRARAGGHRAVQACP